MNIWEYVFNSIYALTHIHTQKHNASGAWKTYDNILLNRHDMWTGTANATNPQSYRVLNRMLGAKFYLTWRCRYISISSQQVRVLCDRMHATRARSGWLRWGRRRLLYNIWQGQSRAEAYYTLDRVMWAIKCMLGEVSDLSDCSVCSRQPEVWRSSCSVSIWPRCTHKTNKKLEIHAKIHFMLQWYTVLRSVHRV